MHYTVVGEHGGASRLGKVRALESRSRGADQGGLGASGRNWRSPTARSTSRSSPGSCGIPSVQMQDYEFANLQRQIAFRAARRVLAPDSIPVDRLRKIGAEAEEAGPLSRA